MFNFWLQLSFDGVTVENVEVGKLYTFLEPFEFELNNAVYIRKAEDIPTMDMRVRMNRLNHKSFTYKIDVTSDKDTVAWVRVFMGPKYDYLGNEMDLNERRKYFVEMDRFPYQGTFKQRQ
jgi:hypothetical protein